MLLTGMLFASGSFVSCNNDDDKVDKINTLSVAPLSAIQFKATGNADVVLNVTTDAEKWSYTAPDWVTAKQEGKTLTVNAKDNTTGGTRAGRIEFAAGNAKAIVINISQSAPAEGDDNVLSVEPSTDIAFLASGNTDVVLTVTTDAASWAYEAPEWVTATKEGDKLTVNAKDNTADATRAGRIEFTAGTAKPVAVIVSQKGAGEGPDEKVAASLKDESGEHTVVFTATGKEEDGTITANVVLTLEKAAEAEASVQIFIDEAYLAEYNFINKTKCVIYPSSLISIANEGNVTLPAGQTESGNISLTFNVADEMLKYSTEYLIPLYVKVKSDNVSVADETCRVNYIVKKKNPKEVKNVLYFEVNDVNPLNALEYKLADGSYFYDAIILFAANINYDPTEDRVFLNNNPNVQALLDESDVYLQPLREAGIKVYLGLLGNHDAAGLCQLSDWGCEQFGMELALACEQYKLDGVNFDDEYSSSPIIGNKWFTYPSNAAGARLCYETKKAMKEIIPWDTEVSIFSYGSMYNLPDVDGHQAVEFCDFSVANYGGSTSPMNGQTYKNCSGMSIELNIGAGSIDEDRARRIKESGYGWIMWFAFAPVGKEIGSGTVYSNLERAMRQMRATSLGLYEQELLDPVGYYKKTGEGQYDPQRYMF